MNRNILFSSKVFRIITIIIIGILLMASTRGNSNLPVNTVEDLSSQGEVESSLDGPVSMDTSTVGMYSTTQKTWYLKAANDDGWANVETVRFGSTSTSWIPVVGDWNGNGTDTVGMYSRTQKTWYLKGSNNDGWANVTTVRFGSSDSSWIPVVGDWNGNGTDTIGMYSRTQKTWYLKGSNNDGWADVTTVRFGSTDSSWIPVVGDWNGNGTDTVGMYSRTQKTWYLKGSNTDGWANVTTVRFGSSDSSWIPVVGDWNGNGTDTIGMYSRGQKTWYLKGANNDGWANVSTVRFGSTSTSWIPVVGDWDISSGPTCYTLSRYYSGSGSAPTASPANSTGCSTGQYTANQGITMTAHPASGWSLDYWSGTNFPNTPFFQMPSSNHSVTAHYEQTSPTTLRVINDLYDQDVGGWDWGKYNSIIWVKVAPTCAAFGTYPFSGTELLWPYETTSNISETWRIAPDYLQTTSYEDFDVSFMGGDYCVLIQTGWWDSIFSVFYPYNFLYYEKTPTNVMCCDNVNLCHKWYMISVTAPYGDPEVITASDWLPHGSWPGHWSCP